MSSPVIYFEIGVRNGEKGKEFYSKMFDWKINTNMPDYHEIAKDGEGISGGIFPIKEGEMPPYVTIYVQVDDLQKYLDKAAELGGKQIVPPTALPPGMGSFAMFADPDGNCVGLWTV